MFRASEHTWEQMLADRPGPPRHYIHDLEKGATTSKAELAVLHVGRHHACHWKGHTCEVLSTSCLCSEALRRLRPDWVMQVIFVPMTQWDDVATDLSTPKAVEQISDLPRFCKVHRVDFDAVTGLSYLLREVCLDKRQ